MSLDLPLSHWMPGSAVGPGGAVGPNSPPERVETLQKTLLRVLACLPRALQQLVVQRRLCLCDAVVDGESSHGFSFCQDRLASVGLLRAFCHSLSQESATQKVQTVLQLGSGVLDTRFVISD